MFAFIFFSHTQTDAFACGRYHHEPHLRYMGTHHDALDIVAAGPMHVPGTTP